MLPYVWRITNPCMYRGQRRMSSLWLTPWDLEPSWQPGSQLLLLFLFLQHWAHGVIPGLLCGCWGFEFKSLSLCSRCSHSLSCLFQPHIVLFYTFTIWVSAFLITTTKCLTKAMWGGRIYLDSIWGFSPSWWERSSSRSEAAAAHTVSQIRKQW